jgi:NADP-dependent 3-hydroxy acid dehydrogenase YdfG
MSRAPRSFQRQPSEGDMGALEGKVAWVTGAGSGIGQAAAVALAREGAAVVLTGRRKEPLEETAATIGKAGGKALVKAGDLMKSAVVSRIVADIEKRFGRLDILVNNAGLNVTDRTWEKLTPEGIDTVVQGNLASAFYCATAVLPMMRRQKDGVLIHTSSMAGRFPSILSGATYSATKHAVVAMSHVLNMEECVNGIRSTVFCPGEVATPILDRRPIPVSREERARMVQSEDCGDLIRYIACLPAHVCINEVLMTPTWNRTYVANLQRQQAQAGAKGK